MTGCSSVWQSCSTSSGLKWRGGKWALGMFRVSDSFYTVRTFWMTIRLISSNSANRRSNFYVSLWHAMFYHFRLRSILIQWARHNLLMCRVPVLLMRQLLSIAALDADRRCLLEASFAPLIVQSTSSNHFLSLPFNGHLSAAFGLPFGHR